MSKSDQVEAIAGILGFLAMVVGAILWAFPWQGALCIIGGLVFFVCLISALIDSEKGSNDE